MGIEEQIRDIVEQEFSFQLKEIESRLRTSSRKENRTLREEIQTFHIRLDNINGQLADIIARIEKLEEELTNRWGLVVKLRKYTLDQLMSEYRKLTGQIRPEQQESVENVEK
jgi:hypothetical protein